MARVEMMYPIVAVDGKFSTGIYQTYKWGIDLYQRNKIQRSYAKKKNIRLSKPCLGFQKADKYYSAFPEPEKQIWRDAVKKRVLSGYTLWMKECLYLWGQGLNSPLKPSISGGFTREKAITGGPYPPPS